MVGTLVILPLLLLRDVCTLCFQTGVTILFILCGEKSGTGATLICHLFPNKAMGILYTLRKVGKGRDMGVPNKQVAHLSLCR